MEEKGVTETIHHCTANIRKLWNGMCKFLLGLEDGQGLETIYFDYRTYSPPFQGSVDQHPQLCCVLGTHDPPPPSSLMY